MKESIKGKISQIIGAVVDVTFDDDVTLPDIYDALMVVRPDGTEVVLECQQDIGENTMRTIAMDSTDGLQRGTEVISLGGPISMPVSENINGRLFNVIGKAIDGMPDPSYEKRYSIHQDPPKFENLATSQEVLFTGIKVIDLPAFPQGRQDWPFRWCGRRKNRTYSGTYQQYCQEIFRHVGLYWRR